ncbi:MAG: hypothetical protein GY731_16085, partial [Gammaproteobacteria bacterium]|nr:hypothetical protein [Gammaproteobacteria bacterium]
MSNVSRRTAIHIFLLFSVLVLFLGAAIGVFNVGFDSTGMLSLNNKGLPAGDLPVVVSSSEFLILFGVGLLMCALLPLLTPIQASLLTL